MGQKIDRTYLFERMPVGQAVRRQIIPSIASQMVILLYNLADTYFVGLLNDAAQTAAVSLAYSVTLLMTALANLFAVGGAGRIAQLLGRRDRDGAREVCAVSFWFALLASAAFCVLFTLLSSPILRLCGATDETYALACGYSRWVISVGGTFSILNTVLANLIRADGSAFAASMGVSAGGIINMLLDPLFVLPRFLGMGAEGAGLATAISNAAGMLILLGIIAARRRVGVVALRPGDLRATRRHIGRILRIGLPSAVQFLLTLVAVGALTKFMSLYDTAAVAALRETLEPKLRELELEPLYYDVELPLCAVLARMEQRGFLIDRAALAQFGETLQTSITQLEQQIYAAAGAPFNINSPKQLGKVLFEDMHLPHGKKTKTGWSTNADVLDKLRGVPIVADVLQYRQYAKLKSTYADGLLKAVSPDGRIRTSFQMTVTATGRLSSTEPNLQNIPTRTELGSQMRRMFVAAPGNVLVDADYSQIELRLLAHISGDEAMCRAFRSGEDFHTLTAARVFHVEPQDVTPEMRRRAKAVNFGVVYGISPFSLSQDIGVTVAEAKEYMERYFQTYTGVRAYMDRIVEQARADGYVETLMHRRRALPELKSSNHNLRAFGERVALNMPIQGTAADLMKLAMVRVERRLADEGLAAQLIMQVHDELIVECPEDEAARVQALLEEEMSGVMTLAVPLPAEAHCGKNWLTAKG